MNKKLSLCFLGFLSLNAIAEQTNTVSWYLKNPDERKKVLLLCNDNPGELKNTPNCINALAAARRASAGSLPKNLKFN